MLTSAGAVLIALLVNPQIYLRPVASWVHVREICGADVQACTQFIEPQLTATCSRMNSSWGMTAEARYTALVYYTTEKLVSHEVSHMADLKDGTLRHVRDLQSRRYPTEKACTAAALVATRDFRAQLQAFAAASNASRQ